MISCYNLMSLGCMSIWGWLRDHSKLGQQIVCHGKPCILVQNFEIRTTFTVVRVNEFKTGYIEVGGHGCYCASLLDRFILTDQSSYL